MHQRAPCVRTHIEAFVCGNQPQMSEVDFRLITFCSDFKADLRAHPLALVLDVVEMIVQDEPDHLFIRNELYDLDPGVVDVPDALRDSSPTWWLLPSLSSPHHPRTLLIASKATFGDWSTKNVVVKS